MPVNLLSLVFLFSTAVASGVGRDRREPKVGGRPDPAVPEPDPNSASYRGVVLVLLAATLLATAAILAASWKVANLVLLDTAVILLLAGGILAGVLSAMAARGRPLQPREEMAGPGATSEAEPQGPKSSVEDSPHMLARFADARARIEAEVRELDGLAGIRVGTATLGVLGIVFVLVAVPTSTPVSDWFAVIAAFCLAAAGLALTAARYLGAIDPVRFPESPWLCRGARVLAWVFVLAALSIGLLWAGELNLLRIVHFAMVGLAAAICFGLFTVQQPKPEAADVFPLELPVLEVLGSRTNILGSILDAAEQRLGIDIRSTWALTVVRRSLEPLAISLVLVAWLSTSFTVVNLEEQGLVERFGVPVDAPLAPGLHLHWPFPIDRVVRFPVQRVQTTTVGHEGQEEGGPENVLWAVEHAANEYTLLLGNGRDLITVDAAVQYRIADSRAWRYHCQNPADALRAIAYRAVMRNTVNRTLSEALSENVATLTATMRQMVQHDADAMGLGVEVVAFTVGGMHPPVAVASDYQAVVSAEISKVTDVVNAQAFRNQTVPATEAAVVTRLNTAQADGAKDSAKAAGEAWSFRTLESQYRVAPQDYVFRRRLETLERNLAGRRFTVVDSRFQRDGGELWLIP